ncbi:unnamed protein product, partial [Durusdinium trenchii]
MLQSLATFTAGVFTGQSLNACHANLPRCSLQEEEGCRLFLHVHGARVPTSEPGIWSQRPQLVVRLADCEKHTEPAVFAPKAGEAHCNWHFGDTLTFVLRARDLMGAGLHVHLQGKRDFRFGLFQVDLSQSSDLGDGLLDLRQLLHRCQASNDARWESPIVEIPLLHFRAATAQEAAPSVFVQVSLNGDPNALLKQVEMAEKPVVERMVYPCVQCVTSEEASGTEPESEEPPEADYRTCEVPSLRAQTQDIAFPAQSLAPGYQCGYRGPWELHTIPGGTSLPLTRLPQPRPSQAFAPPAHNSHRWKIA